MEATLKDQYFADKRDFFKWDLLEDLIALPVVDSRSATSPCLHHLMGQGRAFSSGTRWAHGEPSFTTFSNRVRALAVDKLAPCVNTSSLEVSNTGP